MIGGGGFEWCRWTTQRGRKFSKDAPTKRFTVGGALGLPGGFFSGTGFIDSAQVRVIFWDGDGSACDTRDLTISNNTIDINHPFSSLTDTAGDWHVVVYSGWPDKESYNASDSDILADDTSYTGGYSFTVTGDAIPEIPTVIAGIAVAGTCFWIYWWMRKRRLAYAKA